MAGGLVQSQAKSDVNFLKQSIERARLAKDIGDDPGAFPAVSAALALGMMGTSDALATLSGIANLDIVGSEEIGKAIRWIENKPTVGSPPRRSGSNDEELITSIVLDRTFFAERGRDNTSVEQLTLNRNRNKALISLRVSTGSRYARGYDVVLSKSKASWTWKVAGVWFTWIT